MSAVPPPTNPSVILLGGELLVTSHSLSPAIPTLSSAWWRHINGPVGWSR